MKYKATVIFEFDTNQVGLCANELAQKFENMRRFRAYDYLFGDNDATITIKVKEIKDDKNTDKRPQIG